MATILALSSSVARGHVGLSALLPVMQRLGHEVIALPTVMLSNHPGHKASSGFRVTIEALDGMLAALSANGWLSSVDAVITGYLPSAEHVAFAARMLKTVASDSGRRPVFICDPVLGDLPYGLYIEEKAATAIKTSLIPEADLITPNAFELAWLSGSGIIASPADAIRASHALATQHVISTSVPDGDHLANVLVTPAGVWVAPVPRRANVPHGTGDVLTAQIAARSLSSKEPSLSDSLVAHLGESVAATAIIIAESLGSDELALLSTASRWVRPEPVTLKEA